MSSPLTRIYLSIAFLPLTWAIASQPGWSQSVEVRQDSTTVVTQDGDLFEISGGDRSNSGTNLFHSFEQFGLTEGQIATFVSHPDILNIFSRVTGGDPSVINGLIQVTGGDSNLFLVNPAGIIFGSQARLDVPASFTATTADRLGFGDPSNWQWFYSTGSNAYGNLEGTPNAFAFTSLQPQQIVNIGDLAVGRGQNLTLIGGTIVSSGTLSAPDGQVIVAAVPGESIVRLSQPGMLLDLELDSYTWLEQWWENPFRFYSSLLLPRLLTGGSGGNATDITVNDDGSIELSGSGLQVYNGDLVANQVSADAALLWSARNLTLVRSDLETSGTLHLRAGNVAMFRDSLSHPFVAQAGDSLEIEARRGADIEILNHDESSLSSRGDLTIVSDRSIRLDARLSSGGDLAIVKRNGEAANWASCVEGSCATPTVLSARGNIIFGNYTGSSLTVETMGSLEAGRISLVDGDRLTLSAGAVRLEHSVLPGTGSAGNINGNPHLETEESGSLTVGSIAAEDSAVQVFLEARGNVNAASIASNGGDIELVSREGAIAIDRGWLDATDGDNGSGRISLSAATSIDPGYGAIADGETIQIDGPTVLSEDTTLTTGEGLGDLELSGSVDGDRQLMLDAGDGQIAIGDAVGAQTPLDRLIARGGNIRFDRAVTVAGSVAIEASGSAEFQQNLTLDREGSAVEIIARDGISMGDIRTRGGKIDLRSFEGAIATEDLNSSVEFGDGGEINLRAATGISTGAIASASIAGKGAPVTLVTDANDIEVASIRTEGGQVGGDVTIQTPAHFRATDSFMASNGVEASISTAAPEGGRVEIAHGQESFEIGDADGDGATPNGTAAAITTGSGETLEANQSVSDRVVRLSSDEIQENSSNTEELEEVEDEENDSECSDETQCGDRTEEELEEGTETETESESDTETETETETESDTDTATETDTETESDTETEQPTVGESESSANVNESTSNSSDSSESEQPSSSPREGSIAPNREASASQPQPSDSQPATTTKPTSAATESDTPVDSVRERTPTTADKPEAESRVEPQVEPQREQPSPSPTTTETVPPAIESESEPVVQAPPVPEQASVESTPVESAPVESTPVESTPVESQSPPQTTVVDPVQPIQIDPAIVGEPPSAESARAIAIPEAQNPENLANLAIDPVQTPIEAPPVPQAPLVTPQLPGSEAIAKVPEIPELPTMLEGSDRPTIVVEEAQSAATRAPNAANPTQATALETDPGSVVLNSNNVEAIASTPVALAESNLEPESRLEIADIEWMRTQEFSTSLGISTEKNSRQSTNVREYLSAIAQKTNLKPAVIYLISLPDALELVVITAEGHPIARRIPGANRLALRHEVTRLLSELTNPRKVHTESYLGPSRQLYNWLIAPLEQQLGERGVNLLMFSLDAGLRAIPLAALHDGEQFLIEKYRLGLIPSVTLTDASYQNLKELPVLAMGASEFQDPNMLPLPAVPSELSTIAGNLWPGEAFLNEEFTLKNFEEQRDRDRFGIVHLATHVWFESENERRQSYIQFWDGRLSLDRLGELGLKQQPVELLVLSACETAVGTEEAELGFAGLAVKMGAKSVLASLWQVDDEGTLGLMSEFYRQLSLQDQTIKTEALRQAQLAMLRGEVRIENGHLTTVRGSIELPKEVTGNIGDLTFSHPYFWAAFTMIGTPW
ncbi:CHAT domain-containing protein [Oxynema aestuarii]|uniref:CHAT domain-containing protein n=1 Tax=Oxynema aestuarii AP17 TaxID=2064643 RepID=A0A6H1TY44_9CYAN|nr:CHAT domain-containing protein [Oxynema aestuarii]QIZ71504.1 CHAT domain-containing protein [Oxynema aestuarii AP17]